VKILSEADVRAVLTTSELIEEMERALAAFSAGEVNQPLRAVVEIREHEAFFAAMPALLERGPALGVKLVTVYPGNLERGLPSHMATILLFDPDTGAPVAMMDGRYITEARTAAVSALSVRLLARRDAQTLAILGSGVQARSHLEALRTVWQFRDIRAWSPTRERLMEFVGDSGRIVRAAETAEDAVRGAGVIVLVTSSTTPVIESDWLSPGAHVISVGACRPALREMDPALVARGRLFVDSRTSALAESGDVVQGIRENRFDAGHIAGELGELILGRVAGRTSEDQVTIFKSLGLAVEDVAAARLVLSHVLAQPRGSSSPKQ
jgi:alanine dehydrogenase